MTLATNRHIPRKSGRTTSLPGHCQQASAPYWRDEGTTEDAHVAPSATTNFGKVR